MVTETIETRAHTTREGVLNLSVNVGVADADVAVKVQVRQLASTEDVDANDSPKGFLIGSPGPCLNCGVRRKEGSRKG